MRLLQHLWGTPIIRKVIAACFRANSTRQQIHPELQQAINACRNMEELKALLFSCDMLDENGIAAFDRRIDELDPLP